MRERVGVAPLLDIDGVTKGYVDQRNGVRYSPRIGDLATDPNLLSTGTGAALVSGKATFHRLALGVGTYDALFVHCTTAQSLGTITISAGIYPDDGSGAWPDTSANPITSCTFPANSMTTGMKQGTLTAPLVVTRPTTYWVAVLYVAASAPTTAPVLTSVANNLQTYSRPATLVLGTVGRGYYRTGLTALPNTASTTANLLLSSLADITVVAARRSA